MKPKSMEILQNLTKFYLVAAPAAPASVRKQWEKATYFKGNEDSGIMESIWIPPTGISAVPIRH